MGKDGKRGEKMGKQAKISQNQRKEKEKQKVIPHPANPPLSRILVPPPTILSVLGSPPHCASLRRVRVSFGVGTRESGMWIEVVDAGTGPIWISWMGVRWRRRVVTVVE